MKKVTLLAVTLLSGFVLASCKNQDNDDLVSPTDKSSEVQDSSAEDSLPGRTKSTYDANAIADSFGDQEFKDQVKELSGDYDELIKTAEGFLADPSTYTMTNLQALNEKSSPAVIKYSELMLAVEDEKSEISDADKKDFDSVTQKNEDFHAKMQELGNLSVITEE
ncbi:hypothetical protein M2139_000398 [Enterococcus sp. PF1-24]|uniref:hypothetical protein n=1 Tax=unclassified Enterococcus TaxID=2608891 RepID=UPI002475E572|nr:MULTISPECIES: hypothetical protein [unclassified Enterococcus]MDH6363423.1 hypothetical protein [Enterococcus sp. PFB1-1]MDH6400517.1 hypothetical protein [Enterococcus sp. PF1-24]